MDVRGVGGSGQPHRVSEKSISNELQSMKEKVAEMPKYLDTLQGNSTIRSAANQPSGRTVEPQLAAQYFPRL